MEGNRKSEKSLAKEGGEEVKRFRYPREKRVPAGGGEGNFKPWSKKGGGS